MHSLSTGNQSFTMIIDDPMALSYIKKGPEADMKIEIQEYKRTWEQDKELGILQDETNELEVEDAIQVLTNLILSSKKIVAFTGAGISVESGIPAFRGGDESVWSKYNPSVGEFENFINNEDCREQYWKMKTEFFETVQNANCNPSHQIFSYLHLQGKLLNIITQNIDHLHEKKNQEFLFLK